LEIAMHADKIANLNRLQKRIVRGKLRGNAIDDQNVAVDCFDGTFQRDSRTTSCGHSRYAGDVAHHRSHDNAGAAECTFHVDDIANVNNRQNEMLMLDLYVEIVNSDDVVDDIHHRTFDHDDHIGIGRRGWRGGDFRRALVRGWRGCG